MFEQVDHIDAILADYKNHLEEHFEKYHNHVYRVFNICQLIDDSVENREKYAIAAAFHDIGIWSSSTFDYLKPSMQVAQEYLNTESKYAWAEEISLMIDMHHKTSTYKGKYEKTVETLRKADWIDLTFGMLSFDIEKKKYKEIANAFPNAGFHKFLIKQSAKHFIKSPTNPLPMFKK